MSKAASLYRLREISRQRSIRRPLLMPVPTGTGDDYGDARPTKIEWPVPSEG
jgi:hypothetical protein